LDASALAAAWRVDELSFMFIDGVRDVQMNGL